MTESFGTIAVGNRAPVTSHCRAMDDGLQRPGSACRAAPVRPRSKCLAAGMSLAVSITLAACGAPAPKNYGGAWTPVNRFQSAPTEIPLSPTYTFYASPMDATLRTMLHRWASDNGLQLSYQIGSDFTLHQPVAKVTDTSILIQQACPGSGSLVPGVLIRRKQC